MAQSIPHLEWSCFISYKRPPQFDDPAPRSHYYDELVKALADGVKFYLTVDLPPYYDARLREQPGARFPEHLSSALCKSACLVAILTPEYLESAWCMAEWKAMEELERRRNAVDLIIPVLVQGDPRQMQALVGSRQRVDIQVLDPLRQLKNAKYRAMLKGIADTLAARARSTAQSGGDCEHFRIDVPAGGTLTYQDPDPLLQ